MRICFATGEKQPIVNPTVKLLFLHSGCCFEVVGTALDFPLGSLKVSCSRMPWQFSGHFNMSKNDYGMNIDRDVVRMMLILPIIFGNKYLVGGLEHFLFSTIYGIIIPTDELIFFRGVAQPPTRNPTWCDVGFILLGPLFSLK